MPQHMVQQPAPMQNQGQGLSLAQLQAERNIVRRPSSTSPAENGGFNLPIQGATTPGERPGQQSYLQQLERPPVIRGESVVSDSGRSVESGVMGGMGQRMLPGGQQSQVLPKASYSSMNGQATIREDNEKADAVDNAPVPISTEPEVRPTSVSPEVVEAIQVAKEEPKAEGVSDVAPKPKQDDEADLYDSTPRLKHEQTDSTRVVSDDSGDSGKTVDAKTADMSKTSKGKAEESKEKKLEPDGSFAMELEDTADARMRTMRLDAQEEKIFYDPEGDIPKMSATSYPGQEWNPYGEPEFADWTEEPATTTTASVAAK